jgi:hypothetical protein
MANVLPDNVKTQIHQRSAAGHSILMKEGTGNMQNTNNLVRMSTAKQLDEYDIAEARAIDKVLQLPTVEGA